jgi:DNA-binding MarR family transcriptional regulator
MAAEHPDMIMRAIREYLKVPQTTLSSIVTKLEKLDLVRRVINRRDMRSFSIEATSKGKEVIEEHHRIDNEQAQKVLLALDENERDEFIRMVIKIANSIDT